ncbi:MAG TPA: GNAT family N-acetyltransferase [Tepidiformaceae bacterium]|nr:GNAT family N-acetyltransferase [Tepidiformaceae bacterium]
MTTAVFEEHQRAVQQAYAAGLGVEPALFHGNALTVVERPAQNWGYDLFGSTFARGTVLGVAPDLVEFVRGLRADEHRWGTSGEFLEKARDESRRLGRNVNAYGPSIGWALSSVPAEPRLPPGIVVESVERDWLNEELKVGRFPNGAGPADGSAGRPFRNLYGVLLRDAAGEPVALAGGFDTYGLHEIGVDVAENWQGRGLGAAVVSLAVRGILERGATPFYGCSPTNIRSQRTALVVGFSPVCSDGSIS